MRTKQTARKSTASGPRQMAPPISSAHQDRSGNSQSQKNSRDSFRQKSPRNSM